MNSQKIKFEDKEADKKEFYSSKHAILLNSVDPSKIVVSSKWKINDMTCKYFCGYLTDDVVRPLFVILPQMSGYIKYFKDGAKNMSFIAEDKDVYSKYDEILLMVLVLSHRCNDCFLKEVLLLFYFFHSYPRRYNKDVFDFLFCYLILKLSV